MALHLRKKWRGRVRDNLHQLKKRCDSALHYYNLHPDLNFLTPSEASGVTAVRDMAAAKLNETTPR